MTATDSPGGPPMAGDHSQRDSTMTKADTYTRVHINILNFGKIIVILKFKVLLLCV